jgi:hypothetical protein
MSKIITPAHVSKFVKYYASATLLYGFVRSVTYDFKPTGEYYNWKTHSYETKDILLVDCVKRVTANTAAAVTVWPLMLNDDIVRLECAVYGKDPREYGIGC